jgi:hypothetical protein
MLMFWVIMGGDASRDFKVDDDDGDGGEDVEGDDNVDDCASLLLLRRLPSPPPPLLLLLLPPPPRLRLLLLPLLPPPPSSEWWLCNALAATLNSCSAATDARFRSLSLAPLFAPPLWLILLLLTTDLDLLLFAMS